MNATILIILAALLVPVVAQERRRPVPPVPPEQRAAPVTMEGALERNITIRVEGTTATDDGIDLSLTGIGPTYAADQLVGEQESLLRCEYTVAKADSGYRISYSIAVRQRVTTAVNKDVTNYEYRDVTIRGSALCRAGKPLVIVRNGSKPLQITISEEKDSEGAGTAPATPSEEGP